MMVDTADSLKIEYTVWLLILLKMMVDTAEES